MAVVKLGIGATIEYEDKEYIIKGYASSNEILVKQLKSPFNEKILKVNDIIKDNSNISMPSKELVDVNDKQLKKALERYKVIESLVDMSNRTSNDVKKVAKKYKKGTASVYRWLSKYEKFGTISSLADNYENSGGKGKSRLDESVNTVINNVLDELYLNKQRYAFSTVYRKIVQMCTNLELDVPSEGTIRNRIDDLHPKLVTKYRRDEKVNDTRGTPGKFPDVKMPLDAIQIDHTKVDIMLVDEETREEIGRPVITVAIDVYSRIIYGFYISYEGPGFFNVGQCLLNAILPKDDLMKLYGIKGEWPIFGLPQAVYMDNGKDFRSESLHRFCLEYGIKDVYRPVARPEFGGAVERVIGTFMKSTHELPGSTYSGIEERGTYDSQKEASMTIDELERWYTDFVVNVYHKTEHRSTGMTPDEKLYQGLYGVGGDAIPFLPNVPADTLKLRISLLPAFERTVQKNGITMDYVTYFSEALRKWIVPAAYKKLKKESVKLLCRRDPRDISKLYVFDPDINDYITVPYADIKRPAINLSELRRSISAAKKEVTGRELESHDIFESYDRLHSYAEKSKIEKRSVRRKASSKKHMEKTLNHEKKILSDDRGLKPDEKFDQKNYLKKITDSFDDEDDDGYEYYPVG